MSENTVTPYAASKIANVKIVEAGYKAIPPQMMYNYTTARVNAGKAPFIPVEADGKLTVANVEAWTERYLAKKNRASIVTVEA